MPTTDISSATAGISSLLRLSRMGQLRAKPAAINAQIKIEPHRLGLKSKVRPPQMETRTRQGKTGTSDGALVAVSNRSIKPPPE